MCRENTTLPLVYLSCQFFVGGGHHVKLYSSFVELTYKSCGEGPFLEIKCERQMKIKVQNCISILKHLGHSGLDQNFICPAWLFAWKYSSATEAVELPAPKITSINNECYLDDKLLDACGQNMPPCHGHTLLSAMLPALSSSSTSLSW